MGWAPIGLRPLGRERSPLEKRGAEALISSARATGGSRMGWAPIGLRPLGGGAQPPGKTRRYSADFFSAWRR